VARRLWRGDLTGKKLGVAADAIKALKGHVDMVFHLAAVYDLKADEESQVRANIEGTRNVVEFAKAIDAGHLHHVSSIAAAGLFEGMFREDMFDEAENLDHPYFMTKHESEKIVRKESRCRGRCTARLGRRRQRHRRDGQDRRPLLLLQADPAACGRLLPPWMPSVGIEGGRINIVPVDFVVAAIDHIAHAQGHVTASASTWSTRCRCGSATCWTSFARRRTRRR
jgi:thioester reductase-like protein